MRSPMKSRMNSREKGHANRDVWLYRIIVLVLGVTLIASVGGAIALQLAGQSTPEVLVALGSASIGGLAGFLVPPQLKG